MSYKFTKYAGGGSSGGGGGIIDVTSLPTENIDERSIYRVEKGGTVLWFHAPSQGVSADFATQGDITYIVVDELPQTLIVSDLGTGAMTIYLDLSNDGAPCISDDGTSVIWLSDFMEAPYHGIVTSKSEMDEEGMYTLQQQPTYTYHASKGGDWAELCQRYIVTATNNPDGSNTIADKDYATIAKHYSDVTIRITTEGYIIDLRYVGIDATGLFYYYAEMKVNGNEVSFFFKVDTTNKTIAMG